MPTETPADIIMQAIHGAFAAYPQGDDMDHDWIAREECAHVAKTIMQKLAAKGFEIVRRETDASRAKDGAACDARA
jgi:hypothetical protein